MNRKIALIYPPSRPTTRSLTRNGVAPAPLAPIAVKLFEDESDDAMECDKIPKPVEYESLPPITVKESVPQCLKNKSTPPMLWESMPSVWQELMDKIPNLEMEEPITPEPVGQTVNPEMDKQADPEQVQTINQTKMDKQADPEQVQTINQTKMDKPADPESESARGLPIHHEANQLGSETNELERMLAEIEAYWTNRDSPWEEILESSSPSSHTKEFDMSKTAESGANDVSGYIIL